jgi:transcriptional regulator with XRE-family HTH domain
MMMPEGIKMGFAQRLRQLMATRGLTQAALEVKSGVSQSHISKLLQGKRDPTLKKLVGLAQGLDVSLDELAGLPQRAAETLTADEQELVMAYRQIGDEMIRGFILNNAKDAARRAKSPP